MGIEDIEESILNKNDDKKTNALSFLKNIDRKVLFAGIFTLAFFVYLLVTGKISKETFFIVLGVNLLIFILIGTQNTPNRLIPIEDIVVIFRKRMEKLNLVLGVDGVDVKTENVFVLYHFNGVPFTYEIRWKELKDKNEKCFTAEIDPYTGLLIKNREAKGGWNVDKPTNTEIKLRYVPSSVLYKGQNEIRQ